MKKKALIMVHIGDIHFGAFDSERLYKELKYEFIKKIKRLPRIDLLSINGDLFDRDLSMNTNHAYYLDSSTDRRKDLPFGLNLKEVKVLW